MKVIFYEIFRLFIQIGFEMSTIPDGLKTIWMSPGTACWVGDKGTAELEGALEKIGLQVLLLLLIKTVKIYRTSAFHYLSFNDFKLSFKADCRGCWSLFSWNSGSCKVSQFNTQILKYVIPNYTKTSVWLNSCSINVERVK